MNTLIYPILIFASFVIVAFIIYQNTNRYFKLGYSRAAKALKNFYPMLQEKSNRMQSDKKISYIKDEIYSLVAKPRDIANLEENQSALNQEINNLKSERDELLKSVENEKSARFNVINFAMSENIAAINCKLETQAEHKEKLLHEVLILEDQIKQNEMVLFDKARANEENKYEPPIECKSGKVIKALTDWIISFFSLLKKDVILLVPIIILFILVIVDYYVGTAFVIEQYRGDLFEARGADKLILNTKIYSMAFMVFGVVLLMIEFANSKLFSVYNNTFVQGMKWLLSALIMASTFLGVILYLGATRFFAGDIGLQSKLEDIGLIFVWFGLVFVCSLLFNEIKNSERGFVPIITLIEVVLAPFVLVALLMFAALWLLEFIARYLLSFMNVFLPESRVLEKAIKIANKRVEDYERRVARVEAVHEQKIVYEKQLTEKKLEKLEDEYRKKSQKLELQMSNKMEIVIKKIDDIKSTKALFREGSDTAVVSLWGKYIF